MRNVLKIGNAILEPCEYIENPNGLISFEAFKILHDHFVQMKKDTERLDWLNKHEARVSNYQKDIGGNHWFILGPDHLDHLRGIFSDPRDAIDAAMRDNP